MQTLKEQLGKETKLICKDVPKEIFDDLLERIPEEKIISEIKDKEIELHSWLDDRTRRDVYNNMRCEHAIVFSQDSHEQVLLFFGFHRAVWKREPDGKLWGGHNFNEERLYKRGEGDTILYARLKPVREFAEFLNPEDQRIKEAIRRALYIDEIKKRRADRRLAFRLGEDSGFVAVESWRFGESTGKFYKNQFSIGEVEDLKNQISTRLQL